MTCVCTTGVSIFSSFFFFNDTAPTEIYTLSLHDALPICFCHADGPYPRYGPRPGDRPGCTSDRKSTRLNSSHGYISYAVFCLKKNKIKNIIIDIQNLTRITQTEICSTVEL